MFWSVSKLMMEGVRILRSNKYGVEIRIGKEEEVEKAVGLRR